VALRYKNQDIHRKEAAGKRLIIIAVSFFAFIVMLGLWLDSYSYAQEQNASSGDAQILALGVAKIVQDNVAGARQEAISKAVARGVEYYIIKKLGPKTVSEHLDTLADGILPRAKELVEYYHVVREMQLEDRYVLLLRIRVNEKLATDRFLAQGILSAEARPIKILFLVGNSLQGRSKYWWEKPEEASALSPPELALFRAFQNKGFDLVDRTISFPTKQVSPEMKRAELSVPLVKAWGALLGADVVVYGKTKSNGSGEISLWLEVVGVVDGKEVCQMTESSTAPEGSDTQGVVDVLEKMVNRMMPRLETCVIEAGGQEVTYNTFEVVLKGLESYAQYRKLKDFLSKQIPGVKEFVQSRIGSHFVSFKVQYRGDEEKFANLVMYHDSLPIPIQGVEKKDGQVVFVIGSAGKQ